MIFDFLSIFWVFSIYFFFSIIHFFQFFQFYNFFNLFEFLAKSLNSNVKIKKKSFTKKKKAFIQEPQGFSFFSSKPPFISFIFLTENEANEQHQTTFFQCEINPFQKDLLNEFKDQSETDEIYLDEITKTVLNDVISDALDPFLHKKSSFSPVFSRVFLQKNEEKTYENNEKISFFLNEKKTLVPEFFLNKHINELMKFMYDSLIELVLCTFFYVFLKDFLYILSGMAGIHSREIQ